MRGVRRSTWHGSFSALRARGTLLRVQEALWFLRDPLETGAGAVPNAWQGGAAPRARKEESRDRCRMAGVIV
jgi:hypothetical protein